MLAVAVAVIAIPGRALRKFHAQQLIDHFDGVENSRVVGCAQTKAHQGQRIGADNLDRWRVRTPRRTIFDGNVSLQWRSGSVFGRRRDADVIAFDANLPGKVGVYGIGAPFHIKVPGVGHIAQKFGGLRLAHFFRHVSRNQQGSDFRGHGEGRIAAVFLPSILLRDRAVGRDKGCGFADHWPPARAILVRARRFTAQQVDQQNGKGSLIHLQAVPVRTPIEPHVLRPMSIGFLRCLEVMQHAQGILVSARRRVNRPHSPPGREARPGGSRRGLRRLY